MKYIKRIDENFTVTETELNEAKKFYLIGNKEVSRDEVLSYKYSNPEKPVADRGWPKWLYTNNGPKGKTLEWSSIKKDMKDLEKKYGKGNVVVGGSTNAGGPYIEIYSKSQNESAVNEAKFDKKKLMKAVKGDDGIISTGDGKEYVIYKYGNGNDNNDDMWRDKSIFALDQDGEEHEIEYSDIVRYDESVVGIKESVDLNEAKNTTGLAFKEEQDYLDFKEFVAEQPGGSIRKDIGWDHKTKSWEVIMDISVLADIYGEGHPGNKNSGWYGALPDDFESVIIEGFISEAIDWITDDGVNSQEGKDFMKQFHNDIKTEMKN